MEDNHEGSKLRRGWEVCEGELMLEVKGAGICLGVKSQFPDSRGDTHLRFAMEKQPKPTWDIFISHASEDKHDIARPIARMLTERGLKVWFDEFSLTLGDSLRRSIDAGLLNSRFGLVILSPAFFSKEWPQFELDGLAAREIGGTKVLLPIWHDVNRTQVLERSAMLADRVAISTTVGLHVVIDNILQAVNIRNMDKPVEQDLGRKTGKVDRVMGDYGFITCSELAEQDIYYKASWFRGWPALQVGDVVSFDLRRFGANAQAHDIDRVSDAPRKPDAGQRRPVNRAPVSERLFDWAYLGYIPNVLSSLKGLALEEHWEFRNTPPNVEHPFPILRSYLLHTFGRLYLEKKILVNEKAGLAAFNTGLVDPRYEPIHALFAPNDGSRSPWQLAGFCIAGEGSDGQSLVRHFGDLPQAAHYFDNQMDLLYDSRAGKPEMDWRHIVLERIGRYPEQFLDDHWPSGFERREVSSFSEKARDDYFYALGSAIEQDKRVYRQIMNRMKDAIDLSIKRVTWNFKTAIPTYYPRVRKLQLLLPICLVSDDQVDLALAVEKTPSGNYLGHTVLSLDWAYKNARLVCRPDSDWLDPSSISVSFDKDDD